MINVRYLLSLLVLIACSSFSWADIKQQDAERSDITQSQNQQVDIEAAEKASESLVASIRAWRRDWESMDFDRYLLNYSMAFNNGMYNYKQWSKRKRSIISSKQYIRIGIDNLQVQFSNSGLIARVTYEQDFLSNNYFDTSRKLQYWMKSKDSRWRIISEREIPEKFHLDSQPNRLTSSVVLSPEISKYAIGQCTSRADCQQRYKDNCAKGKSRKNCLARN